jgi:HSP20 family protein
MAMVRWDPFDEMYDLQPSMARVFSKSLSRMGEGRKEIRLPKVDILTRDKDWVVRAEMPGMTDKDVHIMHEGNILTITGEHRQEQKLEEERYQTREITYGHFERNLVLPEGVDSNKIQARLDNGVLEVTIPAAAELSAAREIPIEAGQPVETKAERMDAGQQEKTERDLIVPGQVRPEQTTPPVPDQPSGMQTH